MTTATARTAREVADGRRVKSPAGIRLFDELMSITPDLRRDFYRGLDDADRAEVFRAAEREGGSMFALWQDDALGFVLDVLGENVWSKSREILEALPRHKRVAVPSCFASSKSWTVSRAVLWRSMVFAPTTVKVVTFAPKWSQVETIIWPEIRNAHSRSGLPGSVDTTQLKIPYNGLDVRVAWGISASPYNESAVQGIHAPKVLLVVDEAGGIGQVIGRNLRALLTGDDSRMVAIGNPPSDNEGSWFENFCLTEGVKVIPISAYSTPNLTGEQVGQCRSCPPEAPAHLLSRHLIQQDEVDEAVAGYGVESAYVQAKVYARFPKGGSNRILPSSWVEAARDADEPDDIDESGAGEPWVRLDDLDLREEREGWLVKRGAWVRLGIDVAADGGDEFAISRMVGDLIQVTHYSSGAENADATSVAGKALMEIKRAQLLRAALGTAAPVGVKIDTIGIGWGVVGILQAWRSEGIHDADIIPVDVRENTGREPSGLMRPWRKRDEMWVGFRELLQPGAHGEAGAVRLRVDKRTADQLSGPIYGTNASGFTVIESKDSLRKRGLASPDRGEAVLLAAYEPLLKRQEGRPRLLI